MSRVYHNADLPAAKPEMRKAPAGWLESLARSEAQISRGEILPLEPTLDRLRATISRMEAKQAGAAYK
jgi:hypothetical protein